MIRHSTSGKSSSSTPSSGMPSVDTLSSGKPSSGCSKPEYHLPELRTLATTAGTGPGTAASNGQDASSSSSFAEGQQRAGYDGFAMVASLSCVGTPVCADSSGHLLVGVETPVDAGGTTGTGFKGRSTEHSHYGCSAFLAVLRCQPEVLWPLGGCPAGVTGKP